MKKIFVFLILGLLIAMPIVAAASVAEARLDWLESKEESIEARQEHREAKLKYQGNKTDENEQAVVDTGKESLHAALNEAEAWLEWKDVAAEENPWISDDLKEEIQNDVDINLEKIDELREDVDAIDTKGELFVVWLNMVGKYGELLTDVARNNGKAWVEMAEERIERMEEYEAKLREAAGDDEDILDDLDEVLDELEKAEKNLGYAEVEYGSVTVGHNPIVNFHEGNQRMRSVRLNLQNAHVNLRQAFNKILMEQ